MNPIRVPPLIYLVLSAAAMVGLDRLLPGARAIPFPWTLAGTVFLAAGIGLVLAAARSLRKHRTTIRHLGTPASLVTSGPFRISRNPIYLGFVLILMGTALLLGSATPWILPLAFAVFTDRLFVRFEERRLEATFGEAWAEYRKRVRRWV